MNMYPTLVLPVLLSLPLVQAGAAQAYTWVDEHGTTHFSDTPPVNEATPTEQIELLPAPSAGSTGNDDFYSVANQANRMEKNRLEKERLTAERSLTEAAAKKANAEAQAAQQPPTPENTPEGILYYPAYPYYGNNGRWPGYRSKPHPGRHGRHGHPPEDRPTASLGK